MSSRGIARRVVCMVFVVSVLVLPSSARAVDPGAAAVADKHVKAARVGRLDLGLSSVLAAGTPLDEAVRRGYRVRDGRVQVAVVVKAGTAEEVATWLEQRDAAAEAKRVAAKKARARF